MADHVILSTRPHLHPRKEFPEHKADVWYQAAVKGLGIWVESMAMGLSCQRAYHARDRRSPSQPGQSANDSPPLPRLRRNSTSEPHHMGSNTDESVEAVLVASKSAPQNMDTIADRLSDMDASAMMVVCARPSDSDDAASSVGGGDDRRERIIHPQTPPPTTRVNTLPLRRTLCLELTMYASHELPTGWEQTWLNVPQAEGCSDNSGSRDERQQQRQRRAAAVAAGSSSQLPVCVFISSMAGDRKVTYDSRFVLDFLRNKRVPFEVVDFAAQPEARQLMAQISGDENSSLPQVQFDQQSFSIDQLKDLEDHDELDPKLSAAVCRYAENARARGLLQVTQRGLQLDDLVHDLISAESDTDTESDQTVGEEQWWSPIKGAGSAGRAYVSLIPAPCVVSPAARPSALEIPRSGQGSGRH